MAEVYPTLDELLANPTPPASSANKSGWLGPGASAGIDQFQALTGVGIRALGDRFKLPTLSAIGADIAQRNFAEAARNGRQDLESFPTNDLTKVPVWLGYQAAKQLPTLGLTALAYKLGGPRIAAMIPEELAAAAAAAPKWIGGGGLRVGMSEAEAAAANAAGRNMVAGVLAQAPVNYPQAVGSMYDEAVQSGNAGPGTAGAALLAGVPYSLMEGFEPAALEKIAAKGAGKGLIKEIAFGAAKNAAQETMTEGVQTAMEQAFRPDLSLRDRMANVVEGALTGGAIGGVFGGAAGAVGGMRDMRKADPAKTTDGQLAGTVDQALGQQMDMFGGDQRAQPARPFAGPASDALQAQFAELQRQRMVDAQRQSSAFVSSFMPNDAVERAAPASASNDMALMQAEMDARDALQKAGIDFNNPEAFKAAMQQRGLTPVPFQQATLDQLRLVAGGESENAAPRFESRFTPTEGPARPGEVGTLGTKEKPGTEGTASLFPGFETIQRVSPTAETATRAPSETQASNEQFGLDLLNRDGTVMDRQIDPRKFENQSLPPPDEATVAARKSAADMFGSKTKWASNWVETNVDGNDTPVTVARKVMDAINQRDESGAPLRKELIAAGAKLGIMDAEGKPVDLVAQYEKMQQQTNAAWNKAQQTGLAQDVKRAQDQQKKMKAVEAQAELVKQAKALQTAAPVAEAPNMAPPVKQDVPIIPKSAPKSAAAFEDPKNQLKMVVRQNEPLPPERLQKQQLAASLQPDGTALRGSLTAFTDKPVELPKAFLTKLPVAPKAAKGVGKNAPITVTVNHRGEAYITSGDVAKINGRTTPVHIEWMNGAEQTNTSWAPNNLYEHVFNNTRPAVAVRDSASSPENIAALNKDRVQRKRLARIAKSDIVGQDLKNAAGEALTALETYQPGASEIADQVLQQASERTITMSEGDIGSVPPGSEKLAAAAANFKNVADAADWIIANTKNPVLRIITRLIRPVLENASIHVVKNGDVIPADIFRILNGRALGVYLSDYDTGERAMYVRQDKLSENLIVHELIHAATNTRLLMGSLLQNQGTPLHQAVKRFYDLQHAVADAYNKMAKENTNPELANDIRIRSTASNVAELMTYGFTDEKVQNWLRTIPYKSSNAFSRFVEIVRDLLGLGKNETNALAELIDISEQLLKVPFDGKQSEFTEEDRNAVSWSKDRLDREMRYSHYNDGRSKAWVGWVNPADFLAATTTPSQRAEIDAKRGKYDTMEQIAGNEMTPHLQYDANGKILDHEGRHRMSALARMGVTKVPIIVTNRTGEKRTPMTSMTLQGQRMTSSPITINDLIPLNGDYYSTIEERMAQDDVPPTDYIYVIHGGSNFDQIDLKNSGRGEPGNIRPLGAGLYNYVVDPSNPIAAARAIEGAKVYAQKYGRGDKQLHVFRVPKDINANFVGMKHPVAGMGVKNDSAAFDAKFERLPNGAVEVALLNPSVATRVGKFDLNTSTDAILSQLAPGGRHMTFALASPEGMVESAKNIMSTAVNVQDAIFKSNALQEASNALNRFHLFTSTLGHIADYFGRLFTDKNGVNWLKKYYDAHVGRDTVEQRLAHLTKRAYSGYEALLNGGVKAAEQAVKIGKLMGYSFFEIDPRKTWDQQPWLHKKSNEAILRKHVAEANRIYNEMKQQHGIATKANPNAVTALRTYNEFIAVNETFHLAQQAMSLYNLMVSDGRISPDVKKLLQNPMDLFLQDAKTYDDPVASKTFWLNQANELAKQGKNYLNAAPTGNTKEDQQDIDKSISAIKSRISTMEAEQRGMEQAPYFHLGRFGNYALSFNVKLGPDNKISDATMQRVAKAFADAGIVGIEIPEGAEKSKAFLRFERIADWNKAQEVARTLEKQGVLSEVQHFDRKAIDGATNNAFKDAPKWMERLRDNIQSTTFGDKYLGAMGDAGDELVGKLNTEFKRHIQQYLIDMLPDTSINKVMVHREYVPGFDSDMVRSFLFRAQVGGRALANLSASGQMADATTNIAGIVNESKRGNDPKQTLTRQNVARELFKREAGRPVAPPPRFIEALRSMNHAYFLGLSPAHALVNMTQIPVILWPELSKKHTFTNSARAIAKVTPDALKIVKATWAEAQKLGITHIPDATITKESLAAAGITGSKADFILDMNNRGTFDIGSQTREIGRMVEGRGDSKLEQSLRFASITGYYSEMTSRLIAALAARELYGAEKSGVQDYASNTVRQSMFAYNSYNQARATGRMGLAGELTPVMNSFMQYTYMLTEKLYREVYDAIKGESPRERKAARTFLATHLAAVTALTGTLGMPMAGIFAAVFDKLANSIGGDDDEPWNITASYRNWLSDVFGKEVGEVIAKGVPRAFGADISNRAGEQNLLPYGHAFAKLLTDRRAWKEKAKDWAFDVIGSPFSMGSNIITGGEKIMNGDLLQGAQEMVPLALRGPIKAYRMMADGTYRDADGRRLPMPTPGAASVLAQLIGFNPSANAEYSEARGVQASYRGAMTDKATRLRNSLYEALDAGDRATFNELMGQVREFDAANPDFKIAKGFSAAYSQRKKQEALARQTGSPKGVKASLVEQSRFANTD